MQHAARNTTSQFRLGFVQGGRSSGLVTTLDRRFDLLHEGADAADAGAIDFGATLVTADALAGLRRIGQVCPRIGPMRPEIASENRYSGA